VQFRANLRKRIQNALAFSRQPFYSAFIIC
jgi:hypothetical protein